MIYSIGMLCKHFKGNSLLEKNIYKIIKLGVNGNDLTDDITYSGDGEVLNSKNLVIYANIFQDNKLFAREYEDISSKLSDEKKSQFNQEIKVQPLTEEEIIIVNSPDFIESKKIAVAEKFMEKKRK
jgi:hypothetical protein